MALAVLLTVASPEAFSATYNWGWSGALPVPGDYDGDGISDLAVWDPVSGNWYIRTVSGALIAWAQPWGGPGLTPVTGDFDGDGISDLAVWDQASGNWYIKTVSGSLIAWAQPWGGSGLTPVTGDFDGDGISDLAVFDQMTGNWYIRTVPGTIVAWAQPWGWPGAEPVPGDYDGDGISDLAVWDPASGNWYIRAVSGSLIAWADAWGGPGAEAVSGDYDGDGRFDRAVFNTTDGRWYIMAANGTNMVFGAAWGWPGALPVSADFDGDHRNELVVYDTVNGVWYSTTATWSSTSGGGDGGGGGEPGTGTTYYVATTGNDGNPGSSEQPWATPGYASRQLHPGDTLVIRTGRYRLSQLDTDAVVPPAGTTGGWITIRGESTNRPVLGGSDNLATAIDLSGCRYVRLENLEITSDGGALFREGITTVSGISSNLVFQNLYVHHVDEFGLDMGDVNHVMITNCVFAYCGYGAIGGPAGQAGGIRDLTLAGCTLSYGGHYYQGGDGSNRPYDRPDGFGIEASDGPILIENTSAEHNYGDGLDSKAKNTTIRRCVVANNSCDGVKLWGDNSLVENTLIYGRGDGNATTTPWSAIVIAADESAARFALANVTVDDALGGNYLMHAQYDTPNIPVALTMENCIFSSRGPGATIFLAGVVNATIAWNLFYFPSSDSVVEKGGVAYDSTQLDALGAGNRYGDPLFVQTAFGATGNYHLQLGSPAIDQGTATGAPQTDLDGVQRPQGGGVDMGAYER